MLNFYLKAYTFSIGNFMLVDSYNSFVPVPFFNIGLPIGLPIEYSNRQMHQLIIIIIMQDHSTADDTANGLAIDSCFSVRLILWEFRWLSDFSRKKLALDLDP